MPQHFLPVIEFPPVHFQIQYFTSKSTKSVREFFSFHKSNSKKRVNRFHFLIGAGFTNLFIKICNLLIRQWCLSIILNSMKNGIGNASNKLRMTFLSCFKQKCSLHFLLLRKRGSGVLFNLLRS